MVRKMGSEIKKYCKLKNGRIESCCGKSPDDMRHIFREDGTWNLIYEVHIPCDRGFVVEVHIGEIVAFADEREELE